MIAGKPRSLSQEPATCTLGLVEVYDPIGTNGGQCLGCASKRTVEYPMAGERLLLASLLQEITGGDHGYSTQAAEPSQPT